MSKDSKRMILLAIAAFTWIWGAQFVMDRMGLIPKPKPKPPVVAAEELPAEAPEATPELPTVDPIADAAPAVPSAAPIPADELVLGNLDPSRGYRLRAQLTQDGAGIEILELSGHEAERVAKREARRPLRLVESDPGAPIPFSIRLQDLGDPSSRGDQTVAKPIVLPRLWDVVRDDQGRAVRPVLAPTAKDAKDTGAETGQEIVFRAQVGEPAVTVTKSFRLLKGVDGLEMTLAFASPDADRELVYTLEGPTGIPIEGEWYTSTFREAFVALADGATTKIQTRLAADLVKKQGEPEEFVTLPIRYAGVENQYFAVFFEPVPPPTPTKRIDRSTVPDVARVNSKSPQLSDVTVTMTSVPIPVGPNRPADQSFRIFAGPKIYDALKPFGGEDLASYRKGGWFAIPYASTLAQNVISPLLNRMYGLTASVAGAFGGKRGNYGIAIILLTITVRLILFPLSRKQAVSAKKMQDLQPLMTGLKEKYKDDKEAQTRETFALYKKHGVNPLGGCLLGLIQLPIFVGLWQALNNSVALRHAPFLWIDNLAAPDMLFKFPTTLPILGDYFNVLPFAVVGLMLVQTKLFSPPATTPDQEMTQKMMKYMMVFMAFMFYKVPSGLGLYFITSSSWAICERLLLPKMIRTKPVADDDEFLGGGQAALKPKPNANGGGDKGGNGTGGFRERLMERFEQLKEDASRDRTVRNPEKDRDWGKGDKPRPKTPGRKR